MIRWILMKRNLCNQKKNTADVFIKMLLHKIPVIGCEEVKVVPDNEYCYLEDDEDDEDEEMQFHNQPPMIRVHVPNFFIFTFKGQGSPRFISKKDNTGKYYVSREIRPPGDNDGASVS